jgi:hypothetical protein
MWSGGLADDHRRRSHVVEGVDKTFHFAAVLGNIKARLPWMKL